MVLAGWLHYTIMGGHFSQGGHSPLPRLWSLSDRVCQRIRKTTNKWSRRANIKDGEPPNGLTEDEMLNYTPSGTVMTPSQTMWRLNLLLTWGGASNSKVDLLHYLYQNEWQANRHWWKATERHGSWIGGQWRNIVCWSKSVIWMKLSFLETDIWLPPTKKPGQCLSSRLQWIGQWTCLRSVWQSTYQNILGFGTMRLPGPSSRSISTHWQWFAGAVRSQGSLSCWSKSLPDAGKMWKHCMVLTAPQRFC